MDLSVESLNYPQDNSSTTYNTGRALAAELVHGLTCPRKYISPKFFYDDMGSQLFERITKLPEYYPTRTETAILAQNAQEIADCIGGNAVLIEPGAGTCDKVRHLLTAVRPSVYLPQDISANFLFQTAAEFKKDYPWLKVQPLVGDFFESIELPDGLPDGRRVVFYPGSTIGNFDPDQAISFLRDMRQLVGTDGGLLVGVDLQKDPVLLEAAYNDSAGVTAAFNRNILAHANRILDSDIDVDAFKHQAFYDAEQSRIEMHLVCTRAQTLDCNGTPVHFANGETIHTESSYKYSVKSFAELGRQSGFVSRRVWMDRSELFSVHYLV